MITIKRHMPKANAPYQDISKKYPNTRTMRRQPNMLLGNQNLSIEGPSTNKANTCIFHSIDDHDGTSCQEMIYYRELNANKETIEEVVSDED